jgi:hypothetical protein
MTRRLDPLDKLRAANPLTTTQPVDWGPIMGYVGLLDERDEGHTETRHDSSSSGNIIRRKWRKAPLALGGLGAGAAALVLALTLGASTSSPTAYAVSEHSDGTITVTIDELLGIGEANAALAKLGVKATVAKVEPGCPSDLDTVTMPPGLGHKIVSPERQSVTIQPSYIPPEDSLLISAERVGAGIELSTGLYRGPSPSCVLPGDSQSG